MDAQKENSKYLIEIYSYFIILTRIIYSVLHFAPYALIFGWLGLDFCLFLGPSGPTGGLLLLQCFCGVADAQGISRVSTCGNCRVLILALSQSFH